MLVIDLQRLVRLTEEYSGVRVTLQQIHDETGLHRKILSRLINHPEAVSKTDTLEKLALFFFTRLENVPHVPDDPRKRMEFIVKELVRVFPEEEKYQKAVRRPELSHIAPEQLTPDIAWAFYEMGKKAPLPKNSPEALGRPIKRRKRSKQAGKK